jgi:hypothetical protein
MVIDQQPRACAARPRNGRVNLLISSDERGTETPPPDRSDGPSVGDVAVPVGIAVGAAVLGAILSGRDQDPDLTTVPDLVNKPVSGVAGTLQKSRLRTGQVAREESLTVAAETVIAQSPVAGAQVPPETAVSVRVSTGRPMTAVPDLTGLDWQRATTRTTEARLRMLVMDPQTRDLDGLTVLSQTPAAGTRVLVGASVGVTLRAAQSAVDPPPVAVQPPIAQQQPIAVQPPVAPQPSPAAPLAAVPPQSPGPAGQQPPPAAVPGGTVVEPPPPAPAEPAPVATLAQVLPPPVQPPGQPGAPAATAAPVAKPAIWLWPLLLLLLLAVVPAKDQIRKRVSMRRQPAARPQVPPVAPRLTVIPRLDAGRQSVTSPSRALTGSFDVVYSVTAGTQYIRFDDEAPHSAETGAGL